MPSADFCTAVRDPRDSLSPPRTRCRPPEVSLTAFIAHLPNLQPWPIVDTGLCGTGPARPTRLASYSVSVRQVAALLPRFFQTAPHNSRACASLALCLHQTGAEDFHLPAVKHARHTHPSGRTERAHRDLEISPRTRDSHSAHTHHRCVGRSKNDGLQPAELTCPPNRIKPSWPRRRHACRSEKWPPPCGRCWSVVVSVGG